MQRDAAIYESVRTRIRPILMTVLTTFFAQIPLVIRPGSGAELYRGLGAVVLGGLLMSTVFTLIVVPAMLSLSIGARVHLGRILFGRGRSLPVTAASAAVASRESSIASIDRDVTTTPGVL